MKNNIKISQENVEKSVRGGHLLCQIKTTLEHHATGAGVNSWSRELDRTLETAKYIWNWLCSGLLWSALAGKGCIIQ